MRGRTLSGLIHVADWYVTFLTLAEVPATDLAGVASGLPHPDGLDLGSRIWVQNRFTPSYFRLKWGDQILYTFHENRTPRSDSAKLVNLKPISTLKFWCPGLDMWGYISGQVPTSPRSEVPIAIGNGGCIVGHSCVGVDCTGCTNGSALIMELDATARTLSAGGAAPRSTWKLIVGHPSAMGLMGWSGPNSPNSSGCSVQVDTNFSCGGWPVTMSEVATRGSGSSGGGCLFELHSDPGEHRDVAAAHPGVVAHMRRRLAELNQGWFNPDRGQPDPQYASQIVKNGGYLGPWLDPW